MAILTETVDLDHPSTMQMLGAIIDSLLNDDTSTADRNGFVMITVQSDHETKATKLKYTGNLSPDDTKQVLLNTLMQWDSSHVSNNAPVGDTGPDPV